MCSVVDYSPRRLVYWHDSNHVRAAERCERGSKVVDGVASFSWFQASVYHKGGGAHEHERSLA